MELETIRRGVMMMINLSREFLGELEPVLRKRYATQLKDFEWALDVAYLDDDQPEALRILHAVDTFSDTLLLSLRKAA